MALRGNLRDFSLPDVFQLVTFSKKTGVLRIKRADGTDGSVWFRDGDVFFAQSNWHGEPLGERLVAASRITPSALAKALTIKQGEGDGGRRLGAILIEEGYITDKVLEAFVQEQIQDTIFDLMRWDEGEFDFELLPDVVDEDIGLSVSIENVIMEGSRRLEEWTRIKKKIPSMDIVFKMATAPGEGTFEISLKPIEWNLLLLVDGTRTVSQLAADTNRTDFEVARIMYGLFSAGLLEVATDEEVERLRAERAERELHMADLRSQRAQVEAEETREAIEREVALEAEAQARAVAAEDKATAGAEAARAESETAEGSSGEMRAEPEMPEFLAGEAAPASAQDMAVFEEMMGVLEVPSAESTEPQPAQDAQTPAEPAEPRPEPELPPELEMGSGSDFGPMLDMEDEALLGVLNMGAESQAELEPQTEPEPLVELEPQVDLETLTDIEPTVDLDTLTDIEPTVDLDTLTDIEPTVDLESPAEPEAPAIEHEPPADVVEPDTQALTGDLERDLMALGLGELPSQEVTIPAEAPSIEPESMLVEPELAEAPDISLETDFQWQEFQTDAEVTAPRPLDLSADLTIAEIEAAALAEQLGLSETDVDDGAGYGATGYAGEDTEPAAFVDTGFADEDTALPVSEPDADEDASGADVSTPDLSDILESLDDAGTSIVQTESLDDEELAVTPSMGVISTDSFLADIAPEELGVGMSAGLGDELSALTGAGGSRQRPTANVKKLPEPGSALGIHLDQAVDKELVRKVIEGIKNL